MEYCYKGKMMNLNINWDGVNQIKEEWLKEENHTGMMSDYILEKHINIGQLLDFIEDFRLE